MIINRIWAMPNKNTFQIKPIKELIERYIEEIGGEDKRLILNPFANTSTYGVTNDIDTSIDTDYHMDAIDFLKSYSDNSVDMVLYDPPFCYDEETELFTSKGWKPIKEITKEDSLATLNTKNNNLEYYNPQEIIHKPYRGEMIQIDSQSINLLVTPNHRCWVKNSFYGKYHWEYAKDLFKQSKRVWFKKDCEYEGVEQEFFELPEIVLNSANRYGEKIKPKKLIKMDLWLKFFGLYLSEGSCKTNPKKEGNRHYRYVVMISQKKEHIRKEIESILTELGYRYHISNDGTCVSYRIDDKQLWTYLRQFGKSQDKFIPEEIKKLSKRQLNILIQYLMMGDGTNIVYPKLNINVNKMYSYFTNNYYTCSKKLMNDFSEIALKTGKGITVTTKKRKELRVSGEPCFDVYNIHMLGAKDFSVKQENYTTIKDFEGLVYCVTVPNSTLLVKRKGRVFWCGNSPRQVSECYTKCNKTVNMETTQASYWSKQKNEISRIVKKDGIVICCGWNTGGIGANNGFEIIEILLVPHGGWHNDTIITVCKKIKE